LASDLDVKQELDDRRGPVKEAEIGVALPRSALPDAEKSALAEGRLLQLQDQPVSDLKKEGRDCSLP
jgi:hypothetical protein